MSVRKDFIAVKIGLAKVLDFSQMIVAYLKTAKLQTDWCIVEAKRKSETLTKGVPLKLQTKACMWMFVYLKWKPEDIQTTQS